MSRDNQIDEPMSRAEFLGVIAFILAFGTLAGVLLMIGLYWPTNPYTPPEVIYKIECVKGCK